MANQLFAGSIPGQSLTQPEGGAGWEHPPQFANATEALDYLFDIITEPRNATQIVLALKKGMPVEFLAKAMIFDGFQKNKWTPDVGLMMLKIVIAMIISVAVQKGVSPKIFTPDKQYNDFLDSMLDVPDDPSTELKIKQEDGALPEFTGLLGAMD